MDSFNDVMDAVKAYCKGRVSDASYRVFIQDLNLLNFEGTNIIILEVPNDVVMRFAAARYADLLKEYAVSISLSTSRLKQVGEKNLLKPLRETAQAISNELGFTVRDDLGAIT